MKDAKLDELIIQNKISNHELNIIKQIMRTEPSKRMDILTKTFNSFITLPNIDSIELEVQNYRTELEAEKKGIILSALDDINIIKRSSNKLKGSLKLKENLFIAF